MKTLLIFLGTFLSLSAFAEPFTGTWASRCHNKGQGQAVGVLRFQDATLTENWNYFDDVACRIPLMTVGVKLNIINISLSTDGTYNVDDTLDATSVVVWSSRVAAYFSATKFCGRSDWAVGVPLEVTGAAECGMPAKGTAYYSRLGLEAQQLYTAVVSSERDGTSPEKRPTELAREIPFLKQFE